MKNLLLIQSLFIIVFQCSAQTVLPSVLACNERLTASGSPYIIDNTITISKGCSLTVDPGVELRIAQFRHLIVKGKVDFQGTSQQPIHVHAKNNQWGIIYLDSADQKSVFTHTVIEDATFGPAGSDQNFTNQVAAISSCYCSFELYNCTFKNNQKSVFGLHSDKFIIKDCSFDSTNTGENILLQFADNSEVAGNTFYFLAGPGDHIDFDASKNVNIHDNYLFGGDSDAIDIGQRDNVACDGVLIKNNYLYNMGDKGVTNGEGSTNIRIEYNVIQGCDVGIGAKDQSQVIADHNTLSNNRIGVKAYDHLLGLGGGSIAVSNTIIAGSLDSTFRQDPTASLAITYSLSNIEVLPGTGNIMGDPGFVSLTDLHLTPASAAIDRGDSSFVKDPDGTRSDIGRFYFDQTASIKTNNPLKEELIIYPYPGNGKFTMKLAPNYKMNRLIILNILGDILVDEKFYGNRTEYPIDLSSQPAGIYFVQLQGESNSITKKLVIQ